MIPLSKPTISKKDFKHIEKVLNSKILTDGFFQNKVEKVIKKLIFNIINKSISLILSSESKE